MIDIIKQYKTKDGKEVKIFMTNGGPRYSVIGAIKAEKSMATN